MDVKNDHIAKKGKNFEPFHQDSINYTDLAKFSSAFDKWCNSALALLKTNSDLTDELDRQRLANKNLTEKVSSLMAENQQLHDAVNSLYRKMQMYCDLEKEAEDLRDLVETKNRNYIQIQQELKESKEFSLEKENLLRQDFKNEREALQRDFSEKMEKTTRFYEDLIQKKNNEKQELEEVVRRRDVEHKAEKAQLTAEWEDRVSNLRQKLEHKQAKRSGSNNQEIFRMKFLNLKQEYDVEMKRLQQVIQSQEERLRARSTEPTAPFPGRPSLKKRKLWRHCCESYQTQENKGFLTVLLQKDNINDKCI